MKFKKKLKQILEATTDFEDDWGEGVTPGGVVDILEEFKINEQRANEFLADLLAALTTYEAVSYLYLNGLNPIEKNSYKQTVLEIAEQTESFVWGDLRNIVEKWVKSGIIERLI